MRYVNGATIPIVADPPVRAGRHTGLFPWSSTSRKDLHQSRYAVELLESRRLLSIDLLSPTSSASATKLVERVYSETDVMVAFHSTDTLATSAVLAQVATDPVLSGWVDLAQSKALLAVDGTVLADLTLVAGATPLDTIARLQGLSSVAWAAPNYIYGSDAASSDPRDLVPNDPYYSSQYHHTLMQDSLAWNVTTGDSSIIVAVTDDGVSLTHQDLASNIWVNTDEIPGNGIDDDHNGYVDDRNGWDFSSNDNNPNPVGSDSHGTHVAGIIAAQINNGIGVAGVAGNATIMPVRFYGSGAWTSAVIAASYAYAVDNGARIINTSYNVDGFVGDPTYVSALDYVYNHGDLIFNSAGNNSQLNPPRQVYDQILFVAATDSGDHLSYYSNYGTGIDVSAPGDNILSTLPGNSYGTMSGTSMATPNAAGEAALIWSAHPTWTRDQVAAQLVGTTDNIDALNTAYAGLLGTGRLNSYRGVAGTLAPPRVRGLAGIAEGAVIAPRSSLSLDLANVLDPATAGNAANYELRGRGGDGIFGTGDDVLVPLTLTTTYRDGTNSLQFSMPSLSSGNYRFTARSGGLRDPFGTALDGDSNGFAGGNFVRNFTIGAGYSAVATNYQSIDLVSGQSGVFTVIASGDDVSAPVSLGTNTFTFYGASYSGSSSLFVSSNGLITFGTSNTGYTNADLTTTPSQAAIAPLWDDWISQPGSSDMVLGRFDDVNQDGRPDRLIIEWNGVRHYSSTPPTITFQAILQLNTGSMPGAIAFNYPNLITGYSGYDNGASATVGIKDAGTQGANRLLVSYNSTNPLVGSGKAIQLGTSQLSIGSLTASAEPIRAGNPFTLTANNVTGPVTSVGFYRETNGTPGLQLGAGGDAWYGTDTSPDGGWSIIAQVGTSEFHPFTSYAVAYDALGNSSPIGTAAISVSSTVTPEPWLKRVGLDGTTSLQLIYIVYWTPLAPFTFDVYRSATNSPVPGDPMIASIPITDPADLAVGSHDKTFTIGGGPGQVPLPGAGSPEVDGFYNLVVTKGDPATFPTRRLLSGVYHLPGGPVFVLTPEVTFGNSVSIDPAATQVTMNGGVYRYSPPDVTGIRLRGSREKDVVTVLPGGSIPILVQTGDGDDILKSAASNVTFDGGSGVNAAYLTGLAGYADTAVTYPTAATLTGQGYSISVSDVTTIGLTGDAFDNVSMHGENWPNVPLSPDYAMFTAYPGSALMSWGQYSQAANGFGTVYAYGDGPVQRANLTGGPGYDSFTGQAGVSYMRGTGFVIEAFGFKYVNAYGGGGADSAYLYGGAGDDVLIATATGGSLTDSVGGVTQYALQATGFSSVCGYAGAGGADTAKFTGTASADTFHADAASAYLIGLNTYEYAQGFRCVTAWGNGGNDEADLFGDAGNDAFVAAPNVSTLTSTNYGAYCNFTANNFAQVYAFAGAGGTDTAAISGTAGADTFRGCAGYSYLSAAGYLAYAAGFKTVTCTTDGGVNDVANLFDCALDDLYIGHGWSGMLSNTEGNSVEVCGFNRVNLFGSVGGSNRLHIDSLGYWLDVDNNWVQY